MSAEHIADIREILAEALEGESEDESLCASYRLSDAETPWVQVVPEILNLHWPWADDEDPLARLRSAVPALPAEIEIETAEPGLFVTFAIDTSDLDTLAVLVDDLFKNLYGVAEGYDLDVEVFTIQDDEIPDVVPITREEGYHTDRIGTYGDGNQFMAFVEATLSTTVGGAGFAKRWYAVLHRFDAEGAHLGTDAEHCGTSPDEADAVERTENRLAEMIAALGPVTFGDVAVGLFSVEVDGHEFGLVDATEEDEETGEVHIEAELRPAGLVFYPPWDGTYDT